MRIGGDGEIRDVLGKSFWRIPLCTCDFPSADTVTAGQVLKKLAPCQHTKYWGLENWLD